MSEKPRQYAVAPPRGVPWSNLRCEQYSVRVYDARSLLSLPSLDREGFMLLQHNSSTHDFYDQATLREGYYREIEQLISVVTGAASVIAFDHNIRARGPRAKQLLLHPPVLRVHCDNTTNSGPQCARELLGIADDVPIDRRFAIINCWRPIRGPLRDAPLAMCDARSAVGDLVPTDLVYRDRISETYAVTYNPGHRWFYFPAMREDEILIFKCYDSYDTSEEGWARFTPHSAIDDPTAPSDGFPRESIDIRALAVY